MKLLKKSILYFTLILFFSCTTVKYGVAGGDFSFDDDTTDDKLIKEIIIPFSTTINGLPVKGDELHIIGTVVSPDTKSLYIVVDFPRFGILKTDDWGKTITASVFDTDYFSVQDDDRDERGSFTTHRKDVNVHSAFYDDKIAISVGPFLFLSDDEGATWSKHTPFTNLEKNFIRKLLVSPEYELVIFSDTKIAFSKRWDNKFKRSSPSSETIKNSNLKFTDALYFNGNLYISYIDRSISITQLYENNYKYLFEDNINTETGGGVFTINDDGKLSKPLFKSPFILHSSADKLYGCNIFNYDIYKTSLDDKFKKTVFYKTGSLNNGKNSASYYNSYIVQDCLKWVTKSDNGTFLLTNGLQKIDGDISPDFTGNSEVPDIFSYLSAVKISKNEPFSFYFAFNPYNFISQAGEGHTGVVNHTVKSEDFTVTVTPEEQYLKKLISNKIAKKYEYDNITPFLRKRSDLFVDTETIGGQLPFKLEIKKGLQSVTVDSKLLKDVIRPDIKTKSGYWYKNIDKKKQFRLEFILGSDERNDLLYYPAGIIKYDDGVLLILNYYNEDRFYKELFKIKIK